MSKKARQALIQGLLRQGPVPSQGLLADALERGGQPANQATISRDLRELGVVKTALGYALPTTSNGRARRPLRLEHVYSVAVSGSMVVLRTPPAMAHPTALELDEQDPGEILGTIAGDDTVFVATPDGRSAKSLAQKIRKIIAGDRGEEWSTA